MTGTAPTSEMTTAAAPDGAPRIASLDILRGIAILGILFMNINDMGASLLASSEDIRHLGWTAADRFAWLLRAIFADGTARGLLELLFGAGMVILTERGTAATATTDRWPRWWQAALHHVLGPWPVLRDYYRRNLVLFGFGMVHVFVLLWPGDILHTYALAALVAFLLRRLEPKLLLGLGLTLAVLQIYEGGYDYVVLSAARTEANRLEQVAAAGGTLAVDQADLMAQAREDRERLADDRAERAEQIALEDKRRTGTFRTWAQAQWAGSLFRQREGTEAFALKEAIATMLIGAALYQWGVIQGLRSRLFYWLLLAGGYGFGLTSRAVGALTQLRFDDAPSILWALSEPARLATTGGHIALIQLLLTSPVGARLLRPFSAAGRTALSIYVAQTLICLWLLYPPFALAWYGKQGWLALMITALAIDAALLLGANWYVRRYRIAPVEWAWRSLTAGRPLPFRRGAVDVSAGASGAA